MIAQVRWPVHSPTVTTVADGLPTAKSVSNRSVSGASDRVINNLGVIAVWGSGSCSRGLFGGGLEAVRDVQAGRSHGSVGPKQKGKILVGDEYP